MHNTLNTLYEVFELVPDAVFLMDAGSKWVWCNCQAVAMFNCPKDTLIGKYPWDFAPENQTDGKPSKAAAIEIINKALAGEWVTFMWKHIRCDGIQFLAQISLKRITFGKTSYLLAIVRDQSERQLIINRLAQVRHEATRVWDLAPVGTMLLSNRVIKRANPLWYKIFQYVPAELAGRTTRFLYTNDAEYERVGHELYENFKPTETVLLDKNGTAHNVILSAVVMNPGAPVVEAITCMHDITELRQAQKAESKLRNQLQQAQKLDAIGRLAAGITHDFNNMLAVIMGKSELMSFDLTVGHPHKKNIEDILAACGKAADLTRQLLTFSRQQPAAPVLLEINEAVENMLKMIRRLIGENIELVWQPTKPLPPVKIDPGQVDQIVLNLCVNARDAIQKYGTITIETSLVGRPVATMPDTQYVMLSITDTGQGIKKENMEKLFEPFFTTKEKGKGTGLGLATVYAIMRQNNGRISVYSEEGIGTTFKVYLPEAYGDVVKRPQPVYAEEGGKETILIVEDNPEVLNLTKTMLAKLGYKTVTSENGKQASTILETHPGEIHLMLSDLVLPDTTGIDLVTKCQALRPHIKIVLMSGYPSGMLKQNPGMVRSAQIIQKPFTLNTLAASIRTALK